MGGVALARLGQREAAMRELRHSLQAARQRRAQYDIAAAIDALAALGAADGHMLNERDEILGRLRINQLPQPDLS
jgi:hypothetical protein